MVTENFHVEIRYLKRTRRATIRVLRDKTVRVTVPYGVSEPDIKRILQEKENWIVKRQRLLDSLSEERKISFTTGEILPFYGEELRLSVIDGYGAPAKSGNQLIVPVPPNENEKQDFVRASLITWYRAQAIEKLEERTAHYAALLGVFPKSISVKNYKSRWGACSSKGHIIFNWQIISFEKNLFDYVVAHELCHLKQMNHGPRFYQLLSALGFHRREFHPRMRHLKNLFY